MKCKVNLLGTKDELLYYRFITTEKIKKVERIKNGKFESFNKKSLERQYIAEHEVAAFMFETITDELILPFTDSVQKDKVGLNQYFVTCWLPIIGWRAFRLFIALAQRRQEADDFCFTTVNALAEELNSSVNTIQAQLEILEKNGFIYRFWVSNKTQNWKNEGVLIKVRKTLHYLSEEQVNQLPKSRRKKHDEYINRIKFDIRDLFKLFQC
ncbi:helix-turn-helix domain-containing protein [Bacillus sp. S4]|uniref:helix-turn-helix domain-containing protein n=1 Tax=Bacillus sp. S4 TaxID=125884 RepID=UPI00349F320E